MTIKAELPLSNESFKTQRIHHHHYHHHHVHHLLDHHHLRVQNQQTIQANSMILNRHLNRFPQSPKSNMDSKNQLAHNNNHHCQQQQQQQQISRLCRQREQKQILPVHQAQQVPDSRYIDDQDYQTVQRLIQSRRLTATSTTTTTTTTRHHHQHHVIEQPNHQQHQSITEQHIVARSASASATTTTTCNNKSQSLTRSRQRSQIQFILMSAFAYILSPIDLVPEVIFGVFGILDDLLFVLMCLFCVVIILLYPFFQEARRSIFDKLGLKDKGNDFNNKPV